jgi:drug/metabolite transporter (DMT)-like permease
MVFLFGLLSAFVFALGLALQQRGTLATAAPEGDPRFFRQILGKPVWLLGCLMLLVGWVFQAAALDRGSLALVQALQALSLVFALPLGRWLTRQQVGPRAMVGAGAVVLGIVLLALLGQPAGGTDTPAAKAWWIAGGVLLCLIAALTATAWRLRGSAPAALFGAAAGLAFAFQAAATKMLVIQYGHGFATIFQHWPLYAFILAELLGFTLQQAALKSGFLAPATAALNASTLAASVLVGVAVFRESLAGGTGRVLPAVLGLLMAVGGVVTLASAGPSRRPGTGPRHPGLPKEPGRQSDER